MRPHSQYRHAVRADLLRVCHVILFVVPVPASVPVWITAHHRATCPEGPDTGWSRPLHPPLGLLQSLS